MNCVTHPGSSNARLLRKQTEVHTGGKEWEEVLIVFREEEEEEEEELVLCRERAEREQRTRRQAARSV
jgi:hypothetical protein